MAVEPWERGRDVETGQPQDRRDHAWSSKDRELRSVLTQPGDLAVFYHDNRWWCGTVLEVDAKGDATHFALTLHGVVLRAACGTVYIARPSWFKRPVDELLRATADEDTFGGIMRHLRPARVLGDD